MRHDLGAWRLGPGVPAPLYAHTHRLTESRRNGATCIRLVMDATRSRVPVTAGGPELQV